MPGLFRRIALGVLILGIGLVLACSDKGTQPAPEKYSILIADRGMGTIWFADPETDSVVSAWPIGPMVDPVISPDRKYLYISIIGHGNPQAGVYKFDLKTREQLGFLPGAGGLTLVQGGNLLIAERADGLNFIDPKDFRVLEIRTPVMEEVRGLLGVPFVVGRAPSVGLGGVLAIYDYVADTMDTVSVGLGMVFDAYPHPDGRRILVVDARGALYVVDRTTRDVAFVYQLLQSYPNYILFTQSGDRAYVASGQHGEEFPDRGLVVAIDCTQSRCAVIDTIQLGQPATSLALSPDEMALYVGTGVSWTAAGKVLAATTDDFTLTHRTIAHSAMYGSDYIMTLAR